MNTITEASLEEVEEVTHFMTSFEESSKFVTVNVEHSVKNWKRLISLGIGHMFVLRNEAGQMLGGLGCIIGDDLHSRRKLATECYWFVKPEFRGCGLELFEYFEQFAKDIGCDMIAMIHMQDSSPEALKRLYLLKGYELMESHYTKEIVR